MERAEVLRNELLGKAVVASMEKRGFAAFYCPDKKKLRSRKQWNSFPMGMWFRGAAVFL